MVEGLLDGEGDLEVVKDRNEPHLLRLGPGTLERASSLFHLEGPLDHWRIRWLDRDSPSGPLHEDCEVRLERGVHHGGEEREV